MSRVYSPFSLLALLAAIVTTEFLPVLFSSLAFFGVGIQGTAPLLILFEALVPFKLETNTLKHTSASQCTFFT